MGKSNERSLVSQITVGICEAVQFGEAADERVSASFQTCTTADCEEMDFLVKTVQVC